uniref:Carboxypeptidase n=1 Tax=Plectus sambesii TaxID=2011161 RepID=A0A914X2X7_9BILA
MSSFCVFLLLLGAFTHATTYKDTDLVVNLPGLTYTLNFKHYSGYLNASPGNYLHYWLVESQSAPSSDPLILWLNGGPGCSSLGGFLTEHGPFHPNPDGTTLFENVYSWNKKANVLYLEGPRNVGFSYQNTSINKDTVYDDDRTAWDNFLALKDFFANYPEYSTRDFYVMGESYGGVYVPTLTSLLIEQIQANNLTANLVGMAVGNGELSEIQQINSAVDYLYFHGMLGKDDWDSLKACCDDQTSLAYCDFTKWITLDAGGNANPKDNSTCANLVVQLGFLRVWLTLNDVYNIYQDCYQQTVAAFGSRAKLRSWLSNDQNTQWPPSGFIDQGSLMNWASTDAFGAFSCYMNPAAQNYLNQTAVRAALHIPAEAPFWTDCNDDINEHYQQGHNDTTKVFDEMIASGYKLRMLIYNGDVDTACNFLGDEWFVEALKNEYNMTITTPRHPWFFQEDAKYMFQIAGYRKSFSYENITIDLVTVKGAGHFVPTDRPGPALQMVTNFINNAANYSSMTGYSMNRVRLLPQYAPPPPPTCRSTTTYKDTDLVVNLPGLTYSPNFKHYSGYLKASPGNNLHYWLMESQSLPSSDPLILWLNGGPGCSSLGGVLTENGPFHPNPDGTTLFENIYSWNKKANVLYLEAPRNVGFSYQDTSVNNDTVYNDDRTAWDNFLALKDFFANYPEYSTRDFYVTGESYGGVYVPTLTRLLIQQIQANNLTANLVGMAVGNGELSEIQQINSAVDYLYFHGMLGKDEWDGLKACCDNSTTLAYCDFTKWIHLDSAGNANPKDNSTCAQKVVDLGFLRVWTSLNDVYNIYQDCYQQTAASFKSRAKLRSWLLTDPNVRAAPPGFIDQGSLMSWASTDAFGAFPCYMNSATENYLNQPEVRAALHIPSQVPHWTDCNDDMNANYMQQHNDTTSVFDDMIASGYKLRILIYNGDVDTACNFLGDEWALVILYRPIGLVLRSR